METREVKVFDLLELGEEAQKKAYNDWLNNGWFYAWADDNAASLEGFAKVFPVQVKDWSYGGRGEGVSFTFTDEPEYEEMTGVRLLKRLVNMYWNDIFQLKSYWLGNHKKRKSRIQYECSCPFTGFSADMYLLKPVLDFLACPCEHTTFKDLMHECLEAWVKGCSADLEWSVSEGAFKEDSEANEWKYTEDGNLFAY